MSVGHTPKNPANTLLRPPPPPDGSGQGSPSLHTSKGATGGVPQPPGGNPA